ncbi:MAG: hypothetical protein GXP30_08495 [Verrucomicrobia bacterium]|nr:hypothetical protein [Verrucomicrobiota bacterium]
MSYADSINDEQKATIQSWADDGDDLSAIQKKLADELEVQVTYMEVRFLMDDLGIKMPTKEVPVEEVAEVAEEIAEEPTEKTTEDPQLEETPSEGEAAEQAEKPEVEASEPVEDEPVAANVKVTMSEVLPMGAMAGGTVTFSDGTSATWAVDQMGQLSLDPADPAYRPTEADVRAFQMELQKLAQEKRG